MSLRPLLPHQHGVVQAADPTTLPLFLDMRLGKSTTLLRTWRHLRRILIAAPSLPLVDWHDELAKEGWTTCATLRGSQELTMAASNLILPKQHGVRIAILTTHETLRAAKKTTAALLVKNFDGIAIDESTAIKNPKAALTKLSLKHLCHASNRATLSGLPHPQGIHEVWCQMAFACGGEWMGYRNFWEWRQRYFWAPPWDPHSWRPIKGAAEKIRAALHADAHVVTAEAAGLKYTVTRMKISAPMHPRAAKIAAQVKDTWQWPGFGDAHAAKHSMVVAGWLHALEGGCNPAGAPMPCWKPEALLKLLLEDVPADEAVVVWCTNQGEAIQAVEKSRETDRPIYLLNGTVSNDARTAVLSEWREDARAGDGPVIVVSPKLAKWGTDLSLANTQIWWSRPWSFEANRQAEARTMHPKKTDPTAIIDLVTTGGADELVLDGIDERRENARWYADNIAGPCPQPGAK